MKKFLITTLAIVLAISNTTKIIKAMQNENKPASAVEEAKTKALLEELQKASQEYKKDLEQNKKDLNRLEKDIETYKNTITNAINYLKQLKKQLHTYERAGDKEKIEKVWYFAMGVGIAVGALVSFDVSAFILKKTGFLDEAALTYTAGTASRCLFVGIPTTMWLLLTNSIGRVKKFFLEAFEKTKVPFVWVGGKIKSPFVWGYDKLTRRKIESDIENSLTQNLNLTNDVCQSLVGKEVTKEVGTPYGFTTEEGLIDACARFGVTVTKKTQNEIMKTDEIVKIVNTICNAANIDACSPILQEISTFLNDSTLNPFAKLVNVLNYLKGQKDSMDPAIYSQIFVN